MLVQKYIFYLNLQRVIAIFFKKYSFILQLIFLFIFFICEKQVISAKNCIFAKLFKQ